MPIRPDIRFCSAADGAKIAVGSYGSGPPLVRAGTWLTHVEYDATSPLSKHWCEELAKRHRYVVYDGRGCGLSDREVADLSLDVFVADLEAVVDGLGLERFPLFGMSMGAPVAVAYAAKHPERVSRLREWIGASRTDGFTRLMRDVKPTETEKLAVLARLRSASKAAAENLPRLLATLA